MPREPQRITGAGVSTCAECGQLTKRGACLACPAAELAYGSGPVVVFPSPLAVPELTHRARLALRSMVKVRRIAEKMASAGSDPDPEHVERVKAKLLAWCVIHPLLSTTNPEKTS